MLTCPLPALRGGCLILESKARKPRRDISETRLALWLVLPSFIVIFGIAVYPVMYTFWLSLHRKSFLFPGSPYVGFSQYLTMLSDPEVWNTLKVTGYFTAVSVFLQTSLGTAVALLLNQQFVGRRFLRTLILLPWTVPTIVNATIWQWIYDPSYGPLNKLLKMLFGLDKPIVWLGSSFLALNMIILADTWRMLPLYVIMILAALQTIPSELYEAAVVDGCNAWQRFRHITLPLIKPMLLVIVVLRTMQAFRVFDIIYILTQGGPANGTMAISFYVYFQTFKYLNFGYGSAGAMIVTLLILLITLVYVRVLKTES